MPRSMSVSPDAVRTAACELFARQGYRGTSMKDIGGALAVSAPNLYNHVPNKQDLLVTIMDTAMDRAHRALDEALAGVDDVAEQLRRATETSVLDFLSHPAEITVCNTEIRSLEEPGRSRIIGKRDAYAARIRAIVERGCAEGRFRTAHPRPATFAILELPANATAWFNERGKLSAEEVARIYGDFALDIVRCTPRPRRRGKS
ncbi:MAG: TetR/AcrR family transcriptional regulator [Actinomycetota bacterium]